MNLKCSTNNCTGCMACYNSCPQNAIDMIENEEGFLYPNINQEKCINCNLCNNNCPEIERKSIAKKEKTTVYACWSKDENIRLASTSGGLGHILANYFIENEGRVYGAAFNEDMIVQHICAEKVEDLKRIQGSKYVQSKIGDCLKKIKNDLELGREVLFVGTPCQVNGLNFFLKKKYPNLLTCDFVCHGVPSPLVYKRWKEYLENKYSSKMREYYFRDKKTGWNIFNEKAIFENGKTYEKNNLLDPYLRGFLREIFLRKSCHLCQYTSVQRYSDITLADFWGYMPKTSAEKDYDEGVSMVLINTEKGEEYFEKVKDKVIFFPRSLEEAVRGNRALREPFPESPKRKEFWMNFQKEDFEDLIKTYMYPEKLTVREKFIVLVGRKTMKKLRILLKK